MAAAVSVLVIRGTKRKSRATQTPAPSPNTIVHLPALSSASQLYAPSIVQHGLLDLPLLSSNSVLYPPSVLLESAVALPLLASASALYPPALRQNVSLPALGSSSQFYGMQIATGQQIAFPLLQSASQLYAPTLTQTMQLASIPSTSQLYAPAIVPEDFLYLPLLGSTSQLYGPTLKLNVRFPLLNSAGGLWPMSVGPAANPGFALTTPTVTVTSLAGNPPEVDIGINADHYAGYFLDIQRSVSGAKNVTDGSYVTPTLNMSHMILPQEVAQGAITNTDLGPDGYADPAGSGFQMYRIRREDGALSAWVEIPYSVTAPVAVLSTTNGIDKNSLMIISASSPLQFRGTSGNGACMGSRATLGAVNPVFQFEVTITAVSGTLMMGLDDRSTDFSLGFPAPGRTNSGGLCFEIQQTTWINAYWNGAANQQVLQSSGTTIQVGDVFHVSVNQTTGIVKLHRTRGGVTAQVGANINPGIGAAKLEYAWVGPYSACAGTVNFGGSAFTYDDGSGIYA